MKHYDAYSAYDLLIDEYLISPDKYVFPFVIKEKTKDRQIITYNSGDQFGVALRRYHEKLVADFYNNFCDRNAHSFAYHKNIRTLDALQDHLKSTHFIKLDIHHFFESITEASFFEIYGDRFNSKWKRLLSACFYKDSLSIGFVTSPMISDYFMSKVDDEVQSYIAKNKKLHYSRYSDDILLSSEEDTTDSLEELFEFIRKQLKTLKLEINDKKTKKISLDYDDHNSLSFLGLAISRLNEDTNKITISKKYILFLLKLIAKTNCYKDSCKGLLDEINSRVGYLYYNSIVSYEKFQKKHENIYGKRYSFVPKKPVDRKVSDFAKDIPDWDKYLALFKLKLHGKAVDSTSGAITANDSVILEEYIGNDPVVEIPSFVDAIGPNAFSRKNITKVILSSRIKSIGNNAFANSTIEEIVLPQKLRSIGENAFFLTPNLKQIVIPAKIKKIPANAFAYSGIKLIVLSDNLVEIHSEAFKNSKLESIVFPDSVKTVEQDILANCYFLKEVKLSNGMLSIPQGMFSGCLSLSSITFPDSILSINKSSFDSCVSLKEIFIPKNIVNISPNSFSNCRNLTKIEVSKDNLVYDSRDNSNSIIETTTNKLVVLASGASVHESIECLGDGLFANSKIKDFTISKNVKELGNSLFNNCKLLKSVTVEGNLTSIGRSCFANCISLETLLLPDTVQVVNAEAFTNCYRLKNFRLPKSLKSIGSFAFANIPNIAFEIPSNVENIGQKAFARCYSMKKIALPATLKTLGSLAFSGLSNVIESIEVDPLNNVYTSRNHSNCIIDRKTNSIIFGCKNSIIDKDISSIGDYSFEGCKGLSKIEFGKSLENVGKFSFRGCTGLQSVKFERVFSLGDACFAQCSNLETINLVDSIDTIGDYCFEECVSLKEITIPNSVCHFGINTFKNCRSLETINLPSSYVDPFDCSLFEGCDNVKYVNVSSENEFYISVGNCLIKKSNGLLVYGGGEAKIPGIVNTIGANAFSYNKQIKKVVIPKSVTAIEERAFFKSSIEEVVFESKENSQTFLTIGNNSFAGCDKLTKITFPSNRHNVCNGAFESCFGLKEVNLNSNGLFGGATFKDCRALETVNLSHGITGLCSEMFRNTNIKSIDLSQVSAIGAQCFENCKNLEHVVFAREITAYSNIQKSAFKNCVKLEKADLRGYIDIADSAFFNCEKLNEVQLTNQFHNENGIEIPYLVCLGKLAFANCPSLNTIDFKHTSSIGERCFEGTPLKNVQFNDFLQVLGNFTFIGNPNISSVCLPKSLQIVGSSPFMGCENLTNIEVSPVNSNLKVYDNALYQVIHGNVISYRLVFATNSTKEILDQTSSINDYGFAGLNIKNIKGLDKCADIGSNCFENCTQLEQVRLSNNLLIIKKETFKNCKSLFSIDIPLKVFRIEADSFAGCNLKIIYISENVKDIMPNSFASNDSLESIVVDPSNKDFESINDNLLVQKNSKTVVLATKDATIPEGIRSIADGAFANLSINCIDLPDSLTQLAKMSFANATLKHIKFGKLISDISGDSFVGCEALESFEFKNNPFYRIENNKVIKNQSNTLVLSNNKIDLDGNFDAISSSSLMPVKHIECLNIPATFTPSDIECIKHLEIDQLSVDKDNPQLDSRDSCNAIILSNRNSLIFGTKNVSIPASVTSIAPGAFDGTVGLKKIYIPKTICSIHYESFKNVPELTEVVVDEDNNSYTSANGSNLIAAKNANKILFAPNNATIPANMFAFGCLKDYSLNTSSMVLLNRYSKSNLIAVQQKNAGTKVTKISVDDDNLPF